ncbi:MAG TPA: nicotinate-nucleotide adenylyltransferase [Methylophilus sp.]|nr:nicotinate-nucleotide adenylyltransferase [Methylophilus sp.]HQQ32599.1 nicotinate-nucleotide adenylyltransferase [Methylophilus sp.]
MKMIGLFGGTFNPIHNGHLHLASSLLKKVGFEEIRFIPAAIPPLKDMPQVTASQRAAMLSIAINNIPQFKLDTRELRRSGISYTIDTLTSLRQELGDNTSMCWLIGMDAFSQLDQWHRWHELFDFAHFIIVERPLKAQHALSAKLENVFRQRLTDSPELLRAHSCGYCFKLEIDALAISSTGIRQRLAKGLSVDSMLPMNVYDYIQQHHLYGA